MPYKNDVDSKLWEQEGGSDKFWRETREERDFQNTRVAFVLKSGK